MIALPSLRGKSLPTTPPIGAGQISIGTRTKPLPEKLNRWDYSVEIASQHGSIVQSDSRRDLRVFAADATIGHTWSEVRCPPRLSDGNTFDSGDNDRTDAGFDGSVWLEEHT